MYTLEVYVSNSFAVNLDGKIATHAGLVVERKQEKTLQPQPVPAFG